MSAPYRWGQIRSVSARPPCRGLPAVAEAFKNALFGLGEGHTTAPVKPLPSASYAVFHFRLRRDGGLDLTDLSSP